MSTELNNLFPCSVKLSDLGAKNFGIKRHINRIGEAKGYSYRYGQKHISVIWEGTKTAQPYPIDYIKVIINDK